MREYLFNYMYFRLFERITCNSLRNEINLEVVWENIDDILFLFQVVNIHTFLTRIILSIKHISTWYFIQGSSNDVYKIIIF